MAKNNDQEESPCVEGVVPKELPALSSIIWKKMDCNNSRVGGV